MKETTELEVMRERVLYWEDRHQNAQETSNYYQAELEKAHTQLGRVLMQLSERWDTVNVTKFFPTDNLDGLRKVSNPTGEKSK